MIDISRRSFLKGLVASAIALGIDPFAGIEVSSDIYHNRRLGLSFCKPSGWEFDSIADFSALRERQVLLSEDSEEVHPLKDPESLPTVIIGDLKNEQNHFAPAIMLWDEVLEHPNPSSLSEEIRSHRWMLTGFAHSYKDVKVRAEPELLNLHGADGTWASWSYTHEVDNGQSRVLEVISLVVFRFPRVHTFYLVIPHGFDCVAPGTFDTFIQSIKYQ